MSTNYLENVTYKDTEIFIPPISGGKVIKVYDGDTITIASKLPFEGSPIYRFSVRINGIDCPEMRTKNENEKKCAKLAKKKVYDTVYNKMVVLKNVRLEKYGRILADVYSESNLDYSLGNLLCDCHLAVPYDGGTKKCPEDWMAFYESKK
tara:strand:- start:63 stop:512 length:450 start_codon:yes stop_codon:yes gene_type:complete